MISAVIPAYNEEETIADILERTKKFVDEIIVVDDASSDRTSLIARNLATKVIKNNKNLGQLRSLKRGFTFASGEIIVNLDADGEHNPEDIPKLIKPILENKANLVLGKRETVFIRPSERLIDYLVKLKTGIFYDSGTGFRALRRDLALRLKLEGLCVCGILVLEALKLGARITQIPITTNSSKRNRKILWSHIFQLFYVFKEMIYL
ncbi:MAG TPA: glycosyltransferase family 2 protein [Candidatus Atribacteria bacterium]|nr:MAG: glycosyltransferase family 2 protein [Candidatus Omnitrophota bacterium]RKY41980.1 MAG: glycosyltransferase family 2 protein [Candidatus Omnitrophota bacterium]HEC91636.1 glycosyltransferase family 2 protein [Candidatus Atribacteria bacterium]